jgi:probable rRNA maturation factor
MNEPFHSADVWIDGPARLLVGLDRDRLGSRLAGAAGLLHPHVRRVSIRLVDDAEMTRLHEQHMGKLCTTDVLTFPMSEPGEPIEADLVICLDEARRRATDLGHDAEREVLLYALHGLLHCAGFDDRDEGSAAKMHAEEDRILHTIGVGATYGAAGQASPRGACS